MQILEIVLYGYNGQKRTLPLRTGSLNIITGGSKTGKSALIHIVDYCMGAKECLVPEGVIRETVSWYGIRLKFPSGEMFVARQNPGDKQTTNHAFILEGDTAPSPESAPKPNTTSEAIEDTLTNKVGISPNRFTPPLKATRPPLAGTFRHALIYCFQQQDEIAVKNTLFHRQSLSFVAQAIKDTLPYFLGAIQEDRLALEQQLSRARRDLKLAEKALSEAEALRGEGASKANALLAEAYDLGLIGEMPESKKLENLVPILKKVGEWNPDKPTFPGAERLTQLQDEAFRLREDISQKGELIKAANSFAREAQGFESEARHQELRLESIGLFEKHGNANDQCPLCTSQLDNPMPNADAIKASLEEVRSNLLTTARERPKLRDYIERLGAEQDVLRRRLAEKDQAISGLLQQKEAARRLRDQNLRRANTIGRISLWLESVEIADETAPLRSKVNRAKKAVDDLEKQLDSNDREERLNSILNRIGIKMTEWANRLDLEHSGNPVRFDIKTITAVVDKADRPVPLYRMGSGENWVGYHLITHLALHQHFVTNKRPVPRFLFLDQPSQVYYPPEQDTKAKGSIEALSNEDRDAVKGMYDLVFDVVKGLAPDFQVIITDHADLREEEFQEAVVERWRDGQALVPSSWSSG